MSARNPWGACPRAHASKIELRGGRGRTTSQSAWQSGGIVPWGNRESGWMWSAATPQERGPKNRPPRRGVAEDWFPGWSLARPAGVPSRGAAFRGCRFAQPPATFWDASGIGLSPAAGSSRFSRCRRETLGELDPGLTHLKLSFAGGGAAQVLRVRGKAEALFPGGTERVAGCGAQRHLRNAGPKTAHPAEGWQRICSPGGL